MDPCGAVYGAAQPSQRLVIKLIHKVVRVALGTDSLQEI